MRRLGLICALLLCCAVTVGFASPPPSRVIYVVNSSNVVSDAELSAALPAFQAQIDQDLGPAWNVNAQLVQGDPPNPLDWRITVTDEFLSCGSCGGYHDVSSGVVEAFVSTLASGSKSHALNSSRKDAGWQLTFSHELAEMLVDPYIHASGDGGRFALAGKRLYLVEVGDPVEGSQFAYERDGVLLSDFVLPSWYRNGAHGPWDFRGHTKRTHQVLSDGYGWYMTAGKWVQQ